LAFVAHHEKERRHQAGDDAHKGNNDDDLHEIQYRTGTRNARVHTPQALMRSSVIPTLAAVAVVALTVSLGNWQLRRADEKAQLQLQRDQALARAPQPIGTGLLDAAATDGQRVSVSGRFDEPHTVFLDNRTRQGVAGFHVLTPMRIEADPPAGDTVRYVLVLRGWIARDIAERTRLPPLRTPTGLQRIEGLAIVDLPQPIVLGASAPEGSAADPSAASSSGKEASARIWQHLSMPDYARWSGLPMQPVLVRQTVELDDGLARDWVQPAAGVDRHRGYAVQWYAMAAVTVGLWLWLTLRTRRRGAATS
jgi:surfeit locus 1 family protein